MRSQIKEYSLAGNHSCTLTNERNLHRSWSHEAGRAHNQLRSAGLVAVEVDLNQILTHFSLAPLDTCHIHGKGSELQPKFLGSLGKRCHLGAPNNVLAGKTSDVGTRAAHQFALDDGGTMSRLRHRAQTGGRLVS